jgi:hypothetical protein
LRNCASWLPAWLVHCCTSSRQRPSRHHHLNTQRAGQCAPHRIKQSDLPFGALCNDPAHLSVRLAILVVAGRRLAHLNAGDRKKPRLEFLTISLMMDCESHAGKPRRPPSGGGSRRHLKGVAFCAEAVTPSMHRANSDGTASLVISPSPSIREQLHPIRASPAIGPCNRVADSKLAGTGPRIRSTQVRIAGLGQRERRKGTNRCGGGSAVTAGTGAG